MKRFLRRRYGNRDWHHTSVHALMDQASTNRDPFDVVREKAREIVEEARHSGWSGPPFDPVVLASLQGIRARPSEGPMESDALIRELQDGSLEIIWNENAASTRRNFSICHELGHTLFPDAYEVVRHRGTKQRTVDDELELLCDAAAAEFLFPVPEFREELSRLTLNGDTLRDLAKRYAASPEATARRIVELSDEACAAVVFTMRLKPKEQRTASQTGFCFSGAGREPVPRLRVDYAIRSRDLKIVFPRHKSVSDSSCLHTGMTTGSASVIETWDMGNARIILSVHAISIPSDEQGRPRVLAFVVPVSGS